ncbi:hypothetical protein [Actinospica robiniae]|uniref:hypothetical protein n=1 Tax=Actinospica robiniae TaxID=304901 RepID=UPI0012F917FF|nr:hypothetical protein [Actinospica robiniae]
MDGIGFFLVNGTINLTTAGAGGGSLGYAQRNLTLGIDGGYLGIGLDAYGTFADDAELLGQGRAAPDTSPVTSGNPVTDTVTVRGPGEGDFGYCWLDSRMTADATTSSGFPHDAAREFPHRSEPYTVRADRADHCQCLARAGPFHCEPGHRPRAADRRNCRRLPVGAGGSPCRRSLRRRPAEALRARYARTADSRPVRAARFTGDLDH